MFIPSSVMRSDVWIIVRLFTVVHVYYVIIFSSFYLGLWKGKATFFVFDMGRKSNVESLQNSAKGHSLCSFVTIVLTFRRLKRTACSLGCISLISHGLSANKQYFSLTPNQPTVLSAMAYKLNKPKRTGLSLTRCPLPCRWKGKCIWAS